MEKCRIQRRLVAEGIMENILHTKHELGIDTTVHKVILSSMSDWVVAFKDKICDDRNIEH